MAPPMMAAFWLCWNQSEAASRRDGGTAAEGDVRFSMTSARTLPPEAGGGKSGPSVRRGQGQGQGQGYGSGSGWGLSLGQGS